MTKVENLHGALDQMFRNSQKKTWKKDQLAEVLRIKGIMNGANFLLTFIKHQDFFLQIKAKV